MGAPLSINSLREDLEVSHKTVARWVSLLERLYASCAFNRSAGVDGETGGAMLAK